MNRGTENEPSPLQDVEILLENRPGALAELGETLGRAGVSIEGGGAWVVTGPAHNRQGAAHFLFANGEAARAAVEAAGIQVLSVRDAVRLRLNQEQPGQLGRITRRMSDARVNIEVLYSDHANNLILVVDDAARGREVAAAWMRETAARSFAALRIEPERTAR
jgi:hypothetical protein